MSASVDNFQWIQLNENWLCQSVTHIQIQQRLIDDHSTYILFSINHNFSSDFTRIPSTAWLLLNMNFGLSFDYYDQIFVASELTTRKNRPRSVMHIHLWWYAKYSHQHYHFIRWMACNMEIYLNFIMWWNNHFTAPTGIIKQQRPAVQSLLTFCLEDPHRNS